MNYMNFSRSKLPAGCERICGQLFSRSVWSACSSLPLSNVRPGPTAGASSTHSKRWRAVWVHLCSAALMAGFHAAVAWCGTFGQVAPLPGDWQHEQRFDVPATGLVKLSLPTATLEAARPGLEDLRLYDDAGREVPYLIERPKPAGKVI